MERAFESIETALQSLHHVNTVDGRKQISDVLGLSVFLTSLACQELDSSVAGIVDALSLWVLISRIRINEHIDGLPE